MFDKRKKRRKKKGGEWNWSKSPLYFPKRISQLFKKYIQATDTADKIPRTIVKKKNLDPLLPDIKHPAFLIDKPNCISYISFSNFPIQSFHSHKVSLRNKPINDKVPNNLIEMSWSAGPAIFLQAKHNKAHKHRHKPKQKK